MGYAHGRNLSNGPLAKQYPSLFGKTLYVGTTTGHLTMEVRGTAGAPTATGTTPTGITVFSSVSSNNSKQADETSVPRADA